MHFAALYGHVDAIVKLHELNPHLINITTNNGRAPMHYTTNDTVLEKLKELEAKVDFCTRVKRFISKLLTQGCWSTYAGRR